MIPASRHRLAVLYIVIAALLIGLGGRVWYVQVVSGRAYASLASQDRVRQVLIPPVRGEILDDTGTPMVNNRPSLVVSVNMAQVSQQSDSGVAELRRLARLLGMRYALLRDKTRECAAGVPQPCWPGSPYQPIPVADGVPSRIAVQVLESRAQFPGVSVGVEPVTNYVQPVGTNAAQVLGYLQPASAAELKRDGLPESSTGVDLVGQAGLEYQYDRQLRGTFGIKAVSVNVAGQVTGTIRQTPAKAGDDLVTSLNSRLETDVSGILARAVAKVRATGHPGADSAAAVVLTTTGRVVAMASYPSYNPQVWTSGISEREYRRLVGTRHGEPILNRATQGAYAPGSTWKVTTLAAAVADGYPLRGSYNCPAAITVGGRKYINDGEPSLGPISLREALIVSCDTVFYELGLQMYERDHPGEDVVTSPHAPVQRMQKMELAWGFGKPTGIDLPGESTGSVPTREWLYYFWKDNAHTGQNWCRYGRPAGSYIQRLDYYDCHYANVWEPGQAVISAIGDGYVTVTPLQLADAYVALANGGTLYKPRIGEALIAPGGRLVRRITPPVAGHLPVPGQVLSYMRSALAGVVTSGTAAGAFHGFPLSKVCVAGKTGTAEAYGNQPTSVFASFAPCSQPKYVVVVMIPDAGYGADFSAPAVRQIWDDIYGLEGHKAALPGGRLPGLPHVGQAGSAAVPKAGSRRTR
jgi:penicillin-binding protein 2